MQKTNRYQEKNPVIRIDKETYDKIMEYSNETKLPVKVIVKEMTIKFLGNQNVTSEHILEKIRKLLK